MHGTTWKAHYVFSAVCRAQRTLSHAWGREAVVVSILVCGKGQEKQLCLTLCTPRICHSQGLIRASLNQMWAIGESLLGFLNSTWDSLLEGRGGGDTKWPAKGCTCPFKGIAGERVLQWRCQRIHQVPWHRVGLKYIYAACKGNQVQSITVSLLRPFLSPTSSLLPHSNLPEIRACSFQVWE